MNRNWTRGAMITARDTQQRWRLLCMLALLTLVPVQRVAGQGDGPSLVILVRHGEKANVPGNDPPLSETGQTRARALAAALEHTPVTTIIASTLRRTTETGAVVASARQLTAQQVSLDGGTAAHVAAVAAAVRASKGIVLVIGHSNTIPAIVAALGGPRLPDICDASYATMFLMQARTGEAPLTIAQYGAPDTEGAASCPGMQAR